MGNPTKILFVCHGNICRSTMAEYVMRYDDFARFLAENGYIVCGHDHIGHGRSVANPDDHGHMPPREGKSILLSDIHQLRTIVMERFGTLPYFLFGHSLGSYMTRCYLPKYGSRLAGAIICGTGHIAPSTSKAGNTLARLICKMRGERALSKLLDNMGVGAYNKGIENPRTDVDWLSFNEENVDAYVADDQCGFMFTAGGYATVTSLTAEACSADTAKALPKNVPLLFIAGDSDPVGDCGKGVQTACQMALDADVKDVSCTIYDHMRHEILNETDHEKVYADILSWLDEHIG